MFSGLKTTADVAGTTFKSLPLERCKANIAGKELTLLESSSFFKDLLSSNGLVLWRMFFFIFNNFKKL